MSEREYAYPQDVDVLLNWPLGTAARLARRRKLPHYTLPDGSIRFHLEEVEALVQKVPALPDANVGGGA